MTVVALKFPDENVERRILGHLPAYRTQKEHKVAERLETQGDKRMKIEGQEGSPYVTDYSIDELVVRLNADDELPNDLVQRTIARGGVTDLMPELSRLRNESDTVDQFFQALVDFFRQKGLITIDAQFVESELNGLRERGYAEQDNGRWKMTKNGLTALTAEQED